MLQIPNCIIFIVFLFLNQYSLKNSKRVIKKTTKDGGRLGRFFCREFSHFSRHKYHLHYMKGETCSWVGNNPYYPILFLFA